MLPSHAEHLSGMLRIRPTEATNARILAEIHRAAEAAQPACVGSTILRRHTAGRVARTAYPPTALGPAGALSRTRDHAYMESGEREAVLGLGHAPGLRRQLLRAKSISSSAALSPTKERWDECNTLSMMTRLSGTESSSRGQLPTNHRLRRKYPRNKVSTNPDSPIRRARRLPQTTTPPAPGSRRGIGY